METVKKSLNTALLIEGAILFFFGRLVYSDLPPDDRLWVVWTPFVGTFMIIAGTMMSRNERLYDRFLPWLQKVGTWLCVSPFQVFLYITSPLFTILAIHAAGVWVRMRSPVIALAAWLIGIGLVLWGAWMKGLPRISFRTILWFTVITLAAFLLRGIATARIPILLTGDEAAAGTVAVRFATGEWNNPFITGWYSFPTLFSFLQSLGIHAFKNPIEALRVPSALVGALTVGIVYLVGKSMFGHRAGLFASLILAALHFHIHFSRLGLNNIWDGLWFTLTISSFWYGWKYHSRWAYLLAGLSLGFSQYFYASSKVLLVALFIAVIIAFVFYRAQFHLELPNLVTALMVTLAVLLPLAWYYIQEPNAFLAPLSRVSMLKEISSSGASFWKFLSQQLPISFGAYTHTPFTQASFWYPSETSLLRPITATFFLIGLVYLTFHQRDSRTVLLVLWLFAIALGNALSSINPTAQRYVAATPACALVVGYGLHKITETFASLWSKFQKIVSVIAYIILGCIIVSDLWFYFVDFTSYSDLREMNSNGMIAHQFGSYLRDQPAGTQVVFFGAPRLSFDSPTVLYLAPQVKGINAPEKWEMFDPSQLTSSKIIFVFLPEYLQYIEPVQKEFPGGNLTIKETWNGEILYWVYERNQ